jgi:hypothetical protein
LGCAHADTKDGEEARSARKARTLYIVLVVVLSACDQ